MKLIVTGRHMPVSAAAREQIRKHLARLERLLGGSAVSAQCIVGREGPGYFCELTLHARGDHMLHAKARHATLENAVSAASRKVRQQGQKLKGRWKARRKAVVPTPVAATAVAETRSKPGTRLLRSRATAVKPMTIEDALVALEASREGLVVFRRADTGSVAIVYRRPSGQAGLIEPKV